jgi:CheY-like chemotaxis protein
MTTWMLIEDEPDLLDALLVMTQLFGVHGVAFTSGEEAAAWIDEIDRHALRAELPELAWIDLHLPGALQGDDLAARLRRSPSLSAMPLILTSSIPLAPADERRLLARTNAQRLLIKPLPPLDQMRQIVHEMMFAQP